MSDKLKNLVVRTLSGAVLLGVVLGASLSIYSYALLLFVITTVGMWEFYKIAEASGCRPQRALGMASGIMLFATVLFLALAIMDIHEAAVGVFLSFIFCIIFIATSFIVELFAMSEHPLRNVGSTLLGVIYVALPMAMMIAIPLLLSGSVWSPWSFLFYLFIVWANDVFAYLVGISIGRHRLCERISPKKSWEGFFGGIVGALAVGAVAAWVLEDSYVMWIGLAAVVAISSVLGDLVESMFKREAGIKDSGRILPGHGGMLDRFDALLVSSPFALAFLIAMELINMF